MHVSTTHPPHTSGGQHVKSLRTTSSPGQTTPMASPSRSESSLSAPQCPLRQGTKFRDSYKIKYVVYCNTDNTYPSDEIISVGTGGYAECFSACSKSGSCAGFTYVGLDDGNCYLKSRMPNRAYVQKAGSNYVSCEKGNPNASAPSFSASSSSDAGDSSSQKKIPVGAVVGGVLGGIAFLASILFLIAYLAKRKRKKIEQRRATIINHITHGPIETQQATSPAHQRSGSTSHDVFAPFGGSYYPPQHTRQRSMYKDRDQQWI